MRINSKGQVTIPLAIRQQAGLLPHTEVEFAIEGTVVRMVRAERQSPNNRGTRLGARLRGTGDLAMSTDEIMALTRDD